MEDQNHLRALAQNNSLFFTRSLNCPLQCVRSLYLLNISRTCVGRLNSPAVAVAGRPPRCHRLASLLITQENAKSGHTFPPPQWSTTQYCRHSRVLHSTSLLLITSALTGFLSAQSCNVGLLVEQQLYTQCCLSVRCPLFAIRCSSHFFNIQTHKLN